ncbi:MAG: tRNA (adenosine(37)-N6)-dimethylallyltransferase MiaA [bacterium]
MSERSGSADPRPIAVLLGPTCSGKTAMALALAERAKARGRKLEVIGADTRQIYRSLTVGTAKPTLAERNAVPHHMVDVADPHETYNAARFAVEAREAAEKIYRRGALPLVVGGSGLYIRSLIEGLFEGPGADEGLREELEAFAERQGTAALHARLAECDPAAAERIHPNDRRRLIRAIEVYETTGRPISALRAEAQEKQFLRPYYFGLSWPSGHLAYRIERRVRKMLTDGMVEEAALLAKLDLTSARSFEGLGYAEALALHRNEANFEATVEAITQLHRNYAKRQRTWFRKMNDVCWLNPAERNWDELVECAGEELFSCLESSPSNSGGNMSGERGET